VSLLDSLRNSRKSPSVLKMKALKIDGEHPAVLIFFFEGVEDVPVYEEWLARIEGCPRYEPVPGAGKQQLMAYYDQLVTAKDPLLMKTYFFVDRDFDPPLPNLSHLFELPAYSIENLICNDAVLDSMLRDEFRRAGAVAERTKIRAKFSALCGDFYRCCLPVSFLLFVAQRGGLTVEKKPEKVAEIASIAVDGIAPAYQDVNDIVQITKLPAAQELKAYEESFEQLPTVLQHRGKYVLEMFRKWLRVLMEDFKSTHPRLCEKQDERIPGDPSSVSIRRFAGATPPPYELVQFVATMAT
jgi:hypothetical protein